MVSAARVSWRQWSDIASVWEQVHSRCPSASFFLSREWVDCWLSVFGSDLNPEILVFTHEGETVGCCLLVWRVEWVRGIPLRRVYLNCAGEDAADSTCLEYNALLALQEHEESVASALAAHLRARRWDELILHGVIQQKAVQLLKSELGQAETNERPAHYVAFAPIREGSGDYLAAISAKARKRIGQTRRTFEEDGGACEVHFAESVEEALEMLSQLAALHQERWQARGSDGCFSSKKFTLFHTRMIEKHFERVMLVRVQAGAKIVGLLYCFFYNGWVHYYQSGFCYTLDKRRSPGLLTVSSAISACLEKPEVTWFDFMAGDSLYKRSLGTETRYLEWVTVRRNTPMTALFRILRALKRVLRPQTDSQEPSNSVE
ncbi:MAG: GNAT family N-acetyltransferase [Bryobacterales bacterium]|nr:GNAT family N-acetyltransferase [Bryobacterales bacterium]